MLRRKRVAVCMLVLLVVQAGVMHRFSFGGWRVDLMLLLAAYLSLHAAEKPALICALAIGLLRDLTSLGRPGESAVACVAATCAVLLVRDKVFRRRMAMQVLFVFGFVALCGTVQGGGTFVLLRGSRLGTLLKGVWGQALLTTALTPPVFALFEWAGLLDREESVLV